MIMLLSPFMIYRAAYSEATRYMFLNLYFSDEAANRIERCNTEFTVTYDVLQTKYRTSNERIVHDIQKERQNGGNKPKQIICLASALRLYLSCERVDGRTGGRADRRTGGWAGGRRAGGRTDAFE